jgi:hypothetical protein
VAKHTRERNNIKRHLVIAVHGIRTYNQWQVRLHDLLAEAGPEIRFEYYDYGFFSFVSYLIPPLRWYEATRFQHHLIGLVENQKWKRIDIIAHSFGTYIVVNGLLRMPKKQRPLVHTLILAGSVLKEDFSWKVFRSIHRVVNDCGTGDRVLILNKLLVPFLGMAGRVGFSGTLQSESFRNRFFSFGHSGYFRDGANPSSHMKNQWLPLLLEDGPIPIRDCRETPTVLQGTGEFVLKYMPIKLFAFVMAII